MNPDQPYPTTPQTPVEMLRRFRVRQIAIGGRFKRTDGGWRTWPLATGSGGAACQNARAGWRAARAVTPCTTLTERGWL